LLRRQASSFLYDKVASISFAQRWQERIKIDLTGHGRFWQEWSELLVRWSRERAEAT
jgi:hypothetical protein